MVSMLLFRAEMLSIHFQDQQMKRYLKVIIVTIILIYCMPLFAANNHYAIIIDAGSSSSRAHVFQYEKTDTVPMINDVFTQGNKTPLSQFATHPGDAGSSLQSILDASVDYLKQTNVDASSVSVSVLATAGMRLLTGDQQKAIYVSVRDYIRSHYAFSLKDDDVKTISGQMEGVYDWLDVNYLLNHFSDPNVTVGAIDMGGASTQIAFATNDTQVSNNVISIDINHRYYTVFSQSFLGLGQDQARTAMLEQSEASSCYPDGYEMGSSKIGHFDDSTCRRIYNGIIQNHDVKQNIIPVKNQQVVAFSGIYYNYRFLNILQTPTQQALQAQLGSICYQAWVDLQKQYNDPYTANQCANGVYFDELLYNTYQLQGSQLRVMNQMNGTDINWTLGALLYRLTQ